VRHDVSLQLLPIIISLFAIVSLKNLPLKKTPFCGKKSESTAYDEFLLSFAALRRCSRRRRRRSRRAFAKRACTHPQLRHPVSVGGIQTFCFKKEKLAMEQNAK
jgi:hypothetical protein